MCLRNYCLCGAKEPVCDICWPLNEILCLSKKIICLEFGCCINFKKCVKQTRIKRGTCTSTQYTCEGTKHSTHTLWDEIQVGGGVTFSGCLVSWKHHVNMLHISYCKYVAFSTLVSVYVELKTAE